MERARVLRMEVRRFCSQVAWASCPSGTCPDCEVLTALAPERWWDGQAHCRWHPVIPGSAGPAGVEGDFHQSAQWSTER